jgi:hypothetical protein
MTKEQVFFFKRQAKEERSQVLASSQARQTLRIKPVSRNRSLLLVRAGVRACVRACVGFCVFFLPFREQHLSDGRKDGQRQGGKKALSSFECGRGRRRRCRCRRAPCVATANLVCVCGSRPFLPPAQTPSTDAPHFILRRCRSAPLSYSSVSGATICTRCPTTSSDSSSCPQEVHSLPG